MIFKCKICGGSLDVKKGERVIECEYCGVKQALPKLDNEKRINLYDRANHLRRNNEYDKAMGLYEHILDEDHTDSEIYWSLVLCRFGVEYVEDPSTHKRVPTVNRAQFTSIFDDDNYKSAIEYADNHQKAIYEEEAKAINEIQKGILSISQQEEPFDVFICYKETDDSSKRTQDSVLAYDLYHQLTQEGFKVFFARVTLEDKLGTAYEPYIFAALNSAKAMVVVGTKPEHFNAVWVKNEWSRYLALIKNGENKVLIPAYKDMDAYDLPEEFSHLQALDMSQLGFMQDLARGLKKIIVSTEEGKSTNTATTETMLRRVFMCLEDGDFKKADTICEQVLNLEPENAQAYLGKLMAELKVQKRESLSECTISFENSKNYQKLIMYADGEVKQELLHALQKIEKKKKVKTEERIHLLKSTGKKAAPYAAAVLVLVLLLHFLVVPFIQYNHAIRLRNKGEYEKAKQVLTKVGNYKDASELLKKFIVVPSKVDDTNYVYDENGNLIKTEREYDRYGGKFVTEYTYNEHNQLMLVQYYNTAYSEEGFVPTIEYFYDEQRRLVEKKENFLAEDDNTLMIDSTRYHYDAKGNMIKKETTISGGYDGDYSYEEEYTYDDKNQRVKFVDSNGVIEYQYDNEGNCTFEKTIYSDGATNVTERIYDAAGNCLKEASEYATTGGSTHTTTYEYYYDENNNCIMESYRTFSLNYSDYYTNEYIYNEQNYCIKSLTTWKNESKTSGEHSYEYKLIYREGEELITFSEYGEPELPELYRWY